MKLEEALSKIHAPKGITSILSGLSTGDLSVIPHQNGINASKEVVKVQIAKFEKQLNECQSDWAYWSILGDLEYWKAIDNILEAAELVGPDNIPDVEFESDAVVVMDAIGNITKFGDEILKQAKVNARFK